MTGVWSAAVQRSESVTSSSAIATSLIAPVSQPIEIFPSRKQLSSKVPVANVPVEVAAGELRRPLEIEPVSSFQVKSVRPVSMSSFAGESESV